MAKDKENQKRLAKEWYERNKAVAIERASKWQKENIERKREINAKWREENREQHNITNRNWNANNKPLKASLQAKRRAAEIQRTPSWDPHAHLIPAKYQLRDMLTRETGIEHHVDHYYPLNGKLVSGLHVFSNLIVTTAKQNMEKSNKMPE